MLELGEKSEEEHIKIIECTSITRILKRLFLLDQYFQKVSAKSGFKSFPDVNELMDFLKNEPLKGNTILIKGSRGIGLEKIYDLL